MASVAPGYHDQTKVGQRQNFAMKKSIKFNSAKYSRGGCRVLVLIEQVLQNPSEAGTRRKKNKVYNQMQQDVLVSPIT